MKRLFILAVISCLSLFGCQKSPSAVPEDAATASADTAASTDSNHETESTKDSNIISHSGMVRDFSEFGLDVDQLNPDFAVKSATKNGDFKLTKAGNFKYFVIAEQNNTITEQQYADYCKKVSEYVKSIADNQSIFAYSIKTGEIGSKLDPIPQADFSKPFEFTYQFNSQAVSVYINYKQYQSGSFANETNAVNAIYLGVFEEFTGDND